MIKLFNGLQDRISGHPLTTRWPLAGPGALVGAYVMMAAMPLWFPPGAANIDQLVLVVAHLQGAVIGFLKPSAESRGSGTTGA